MLNMMPDWLKAAIVSSVHLLRRERLKNEGFTAALVASGTGRTDGRTVVILLLLHILLWGESSQSALIWAHPEVFQKVIQINKTHKTATLDVHRWGRVFKSGGGLYLQSLQR